MILEFFTRTNNKKLNKKGTEYRCSTTRYIKFLMIEVYSSRMLARHISDLTGLSSGAFYKLYFQTGTRITTYQSANTACKTLLMIDR